MDGSGRGLIYVAITNEKTTKVLNEDNRFSVRDVDLRLPEYDARMPTIRRQVKLLSPSLSTHINNIKQEFSSITLNLDLPTALYFT